jgi:hypothetical protein
LTWCKGEAFSARLRFTAIYAIMKMLRPYEKKLFFNDYLILRFKINATLIKHSIRMGTCSQPILFLIKMWIDV